MSLDPRGPRSEGRESRWRGQGPRDHFTRLRTPQTPGGGVPPARSPGKARPRVVRGFLGRPPRPRSDSAFQLPTGGGSAPCGPMPGTAAPAPRSFGPNARVRPTHRARSPPSHHQLALGASLRLRTLPASEAPARGHVTDGRRSGVRVRTLASPARAWDAAVVDSPSLCSEVQGCWGGGCLVSEPVHTLCLTLPLPRVKPRSQAQ